MQLTSIETTPNPNSMKLNLDQTTGKRETYTPAQREDCPETVSGLLDIVGVQSIFICQDFITVNRDPRADWQPILEEATKLLGGGGVQSKSVETARRAAEREGQIAILVQTFRGIPIQVKALAAEREKRVSLGARFNEAAQRIQNESGADFLKERYWAEWGVRYGELDQVAAEVADEIVGTLDEKALEQLVSEALGKAATSNDLKSLNHLRAELNATEWHIRLRAVQLIGANEESIPLLGVAIKDEQPQVRRLAAAALGATGSSEAVGPLCKALLHDQSIGVRRTAGDALSDLGEVSAQPAICQALKDDNKLIRWRAARFLAEIGTEEALPYLVAAVSDSEFEVRLEVEAAIQRIRGGLEGSLPAWKRILKGSN